MPYRAAIAVDRSLHLRNVLRNASVRIELAAVGEDAAQRASDRLADGEDEVRGVGRQAMGVPFENDLPAMRHHDAVGVARAQGLTEADRVAAWVREAFVLEMALRKGQRCRRQ